VLWEKANRNNFMHKKVHPTEEDERIVLLKGGRKGGPLSEGKKGSTFLIGPNWRSLDG